MNIIRLSFRNMTSRPLSTTLSLVLLTLGVGMISLLLQVNQHIQDQMEHNIRNIDMVVGAKGSPLQLILSAVYHIDVPTGNISLHEAERLLKNPIIESGIPLSYGDTYEGYRIVGTNQNYPKNYQASIGEGRFWKESYEVTIGATVAKNLNLQIGDSFEGTHGLAKGGETHSDHHYTVVGIMNYTNSVIDQLILTATESVWEVHEHEGNHEEDSNEHLEEEPVYEHSSPNSEHHENHVSADQHHEEHEEKEITAMLVKFRSPIGFVQIPRRVNEDTNMQAAVPAFEVNRLFSLMGVGVDTLSSIALVIMVVSGLSVFISLYSALKDRMYEMALMRTYGATKIQLVWLIVQEGLSLTLIGFLLGMLFSRIGLWLVSELMQANYHYEFTGWTWVEQESWLFLMALGIGLLASLIPAIRVFKINISRTLADA